MNVFKNIRYFFKNPHCFANGWYSGIPMCCVRFWIDHTDNKDLAPLGSTLTLMRTGTDDVGKIIDQQFDGDVEKWIAESAGYVDCDECWDSGHIVEIKHNGIIMLNPLWYLRSWWTRLLRKVGLIKEIKHTLWEEKHGIPDLGNIEYIFVYRKWLKRMGFNVRMTPWSDMTWEEENADLIIERNYDILNSSIDGEDESG